MSDVSIGNIHVEEFKVGEQKVTTGVLILTVLKRCSCQWYDLKVTNTFKIRPFLRSTYKEENHASYWRHSQLPMASDIVNFGGEST